MLRWNLKSMFTFSLGSLALLLTSPYISCSEAPTGLRSVLCLPDGLCLCTEVSPRSGDDGDAEGDEVRQGLTAPVRLAPGTQGSGLDSDPASLNLRSLRPTPASCIISPEVSDISASWGDIRELSSNSPPTSVIWLVSASSRGDIQIFRRYGRKLL